MASTSNKRAAFAAELPRGPKRLRGSAGTEETVLSIRTSGLRVGPETRAVVRQRLGRKLGKFATAIERVSVRFEDVNGPRGGVDTLCRVKVVLRGLPSVLAEEIGSEPLDAFSRAGNRAERSVRRSLGKTSTKKLGSSRSIRVAPVRQLRNRSDRAKQRSKPTEKESRSERVARRQAPPRRSNTYA